MALWLEDCSLFRINQSTSCWLVMMTWHGLFLQDPSDHPHKVTSHCLSQTVYKFCVKRLNQHDHLNQNCYFQILCQVGSIVTGISTIFRQHNLPQHQQRFDEIDLVAPVFSPPSKPRSRSFVKVYDDDSGLMKHSSGKCIDVTWEVDSALGCGCCCCCCCGSGCCCGCGCGCGCCCGCVSLRISQDHWTLQWKGLNAPVYIAGFLFKALRSGQGFPWVEKFLLERAGCFGSLGFK